MVIQYDPVNYLEAPEGWKQSVYEFDYFSGSQIGIYIGEILVDDVAAIQFQVTQSKRPIYGYASQYFHKVAPGRVLVEGSFMIPFKEADYILEVLKHYQQNNTPVSSYFNDRTGKEDYLVRRENIERKMQVLKPADVENYLVNSPTSYDLLSDLSALNDEDFENVAETFEDVLWQQPTNDFLSPNVSGFSTGDDTRRADQMPLFDIYVLYGDISNAAANHTIKKLIDVSILGQGQTIQVGGEPVAEIYQFISRNLA
jgi:hypothetical protein